MSGAANLPIPTPETRLRRWRGWLLVWRVHRWLGLALGGLIVLLSATGSLLVVHHEIEARLERDRRTAAPPAAGQPTLPLADVVRAAIAAAPDGHRLFRLIPGETPRSTHKVILLTPDAKRWTMFVDPFTARVHWSGPDQTLFTPWLLALHMQLHAGRAGYIATGAGGLALTVLALTGVYLHRDRLRSLVRQPFRLRFGWRVALADLHKWVGLVALFFPVVLGITGTFYAWISFEAKKPAAALSPLAPAGLAPLEPMIAAAATRFPGAELLRLQFPAEADGAVTVLMLHRANLPWQKFSRVTFNTATGAVRSVQAAVDLPRAAQFRSLLAPLHFGFYGAAWVKWAYFVGGLSPALLALSGAALSWSRRRTARGR